jgi:hypothetical protein
MPSSLILTDFAFLPPCNNPSASSSSRTSKRKVFQLRFTWTPGISFSSHEFRYKSRSVSYLIVLFMIGLSFPHVISVNEDFLKHVFVNACLAQYAAECSFGYFFFWHGYDDCFTGGISEFTMGAFL